MSAKRPCHCVTFHNTNRGLTPGSGSTQNPNRVVSWSPDICCQLGVGVRRAGGFGRPVAVKSWDHSQHPTQRPQRNFGPVGTTHGRSLALANHPLTHFWHLAANDELRLLLLETQHAQLQDAWCVSTLVQLARGFGLRAIFETVGAMLLAKGLSSSIAIHHSRS